MTGKKTICVSLILLIIASVTLASVSGRTDSDPATVSLVLPPENPEPGESLLINVTITDVVNMWSCNVMLGYNVSLINAVCVYPGDICVSQGTEKWLPVNATLEFNPCGDPVINNTRTYADDYAYVWVAVWLKKPNYFNGSGTVFTIKFTAIAMGSCTLDLFIIRGDTIFPDEVEVGDRWAEPIEHDVVDGAVTVVPEFPTFIIMPLLLITSLAAVFLGKTFWSRKRKDVLIAE